MVHLNMDRYVKKYTRRLKRKMFDIRISDIDSEKTDFKKLNNGIFGDQEVDSDYAWFLEDLIETDEQTIVIRCEDQNEYENGNENEHEKESENGNENENDEDEDVDENDKDPQYCMFLENLTEHGKSYKLRISRNDEELCFLYYEEQDNSDWHDELQTCVDNSGDELTFSRDLPINQKAKRRLNEKNREISTKKEVSKSKKTDDHKSITQPQQGIIADSCYQMFLNRCVAVKSEEDIVEYEKNATTSGSDSDVMILDNVQNCSEANNKQLVFEEKEPSLREKLMHILKQPYNEKEYEELSEYVKQKKPMRRHLDLRGRSISSAFGGVKKSVLDAGPRSFGRALNAAQKDPPKALNLLRMFRFWLEHLPNEGLFEPWIDKHFLKVRPVRRRI